MWVLDHLDDIDSDMSVFHRVDDARSALPGPLYFARALRLGAYMGVMQAIIARERELEGGAAPDVSIGGYQHQSTTKVKISDEAHLAQLANEGWLERG